MPAAHSVACSYAECIFLGGQIAARIGFDGVVQGELQGEFRRAAYSPDGRDVYLTRGETSEVVLWASDNSITVVTTTPEISDPAAISVSSDGLYVVITGFCDHDVGLYSRDLTTGYLELLNTAFADRPMPDGCYAQELPDETLPRVLRPTSIAQDSMGNVLVSGGSVNAPEIAWLRIVDSRLNAESFVEEELEPLLLGTLELVSSREGQSVPTDLELLERGSSLSYGAAGFVGTLWSAQSVVTLKPESALVFDASLRSGEYGVDGISAAHEIQLSKNAKHLYVAPRSQNKVGVFRVEPDGELTPLPPVELPVVGEFMGAIGSVTLIDDDRYLLAADVSNPVLHMLSRDGDSGELSHKEAYLAPNCGSSEVLMVAVRGSRDGRRVYASNFQRDDTSCFLRWARDVDTGALSPLEPMYDSFLAGIEGFELTNDDRHIYTANYLSKSVGHYVRENETLLPQEPFIHPDLYGAEFLELSGDGQFVWVSVPAHPEKSRIVVLQRDVATGILTYLQTVGPDNGAKLDGVGGLAVSPDGNYLVAAAHHSDALNVFSVGLDGRLNLASTMFGNSRLQWVHDVQFGLDSRQVFTGALQASTISSWTLVTGTDDGCGSECASE
jgi:6-phosphogluconolactonase (cycloisomerase 2 family)